MTSMDHFFGEANVDLVTSWQACPAIRRESKVAAGGGGVQWQLAIGFTPRLYTKGLFPRRCKWIASLAHHNFHLLMFCY